MKILLQFICTLLIIAIWALALGAPFVLFSYKWITYNQALALLALLVLIASYICGQVMSFFDR